MKKNKLTKGSFDEVKDFFDKLSGKKEFNFFEEILRTNDSTSNKKHKSIKKHHNEFDTPEDYADEYSDDYDDEDEAMDDYDDDYL